MSVINVNIVSIEGLLLSGKCDLLIAECIEGEVGIMAKHAQFVSSLKPGQITVKSGDEVNYFYVAGGIIEVQPNEVTILSDTAIRAEDLDQIKIEQAKLKAKDAMANAKSDLDITKAQTELAEVAAQIQTLNRLKDRLSKQGLK